MCGINLSCITAFQPAANGLVERTHRSHKAAIMCQAQERWTQALHLFLLGMRTAFKDLQVSVSEFYGETLRIPSELLAAPLTNGIHQSSLHSYDATSSNYGQSQRHVTPPPLSLSTRTWQTLPMFSSGRMHYGASGTDLQWPLLGPGRHTKNDANRHKRPARQCRTTGINPPSSRQRLTPALQPLEHPQSRQHKPHHSPAHKTQSQDILF